MAETKETLNDMTRIRRMGGMGKIGVYLPAFLTFSLFIDQII